MPLNEATLANLRRKSAYVDKVQFIDGKPLFSWLDLSLTELCNRSAGHPRACPFCPRIDRQLYPNQNLHMPMDLVHKIANELARMYYEGTVVLCGYGEPMLHPQLNAVVKALAYGFQPQRWRIEIVTNGDFLGAKRIAELHEAGINFFVVSMYDGEHQVEKFTKEFQEAGVTDYILRDRWHTEVDQFGLKLTNRGGVVEVGPQEAVDIHRPCHYLTYQMTVDWNGDVLLCSQDWHKKVKFGNIALESMLDIWNSPRLQKRRMQLIAGRRSEHPCSACNTDGTLHGFNHAPAWEKKPKVEAAE